MKRFWDKIQDMWVYEDDNYIDTKGDKVNVVKVESNTENA